MHPVSVGAWGLSAAAGAGAGSEGHVPGVPPQERPELQPWGLTCLGAGHWADWDPGAATGQAERLSPAAAGIHTLCMYMYNFH